MENNARLMSIDAFRGFDMFWIAGGGGLLWALALLFPDAVSSVIVRQLHHAEWEGIRFEDLIFPVFLFISGLSFPFSYAKQVLAGLSPADRHFKVFRRVCALLLLGLVYNGILGTDWHKLADFRYWSVLGKIGMAWGLAALVYMHFSIKGRLLVCFSGLVGYAVLLGLVAPDAPTGASSTSLDGCFVGWLDRQFTPGRLYCNGLMEPSGPFVSFFGYPTALIGMFAGDLLRSDRFTPAHKSLLLALGGAACLGVGYALSAVCPIVKKLWTPSFALVACGWGLLSFSLFHYVIDVRGWCRWAHFFRVIGANAIVAYLIQRIVNVNQVVHYLFDGLASVIPGCADIVRGTGYVLLIWLLMDFLYRKKIFLRI